MDNLVFLSILLFYDFGATFPQNAQFCRILEHFAVLDFLFVINTLHLSKNKSFYLLEGEVLTGLELVIL